MHSHDKTLLASLAFADPDKKDKRHDLACQYLAVPENQERIAEMCLKDRHLPPVGDFERTDEFADKYTGEEIKRLRRFRRSLSSVQYQPSVLEAPISKGSGQYKTTVGYLDLLLRFRVVATVHEEFLDRRKKSEPAPEKSGNRVPPWLKRAMELNLPMGNQTENVWTQKSTKTAYVQNAVVEVKIGRVGIGEILRQIGTYREYVRFGANDNTDDSYDKIFDDLDGEWIVATAFPLSKTERDTLANQKIRHVLLGPKFNKWREQQESAVANDDSPEL